MTKIRLETPTVLDTGLLQIKDGLPIDATLRQIEDQSGNLSPLYLSTGEVTAQGTRNVGTNVIIGRDISQEAELTSVQIGYNANATSSSVDRLVAVGQNSIANASGVAVGFDARAIGSTSTSLGAYSDATAGSSIAIGNTALASGTNAISIGVNSDATQTDAIAMGNNAQATSTNTIAIGRNTKASVSNAIAMGNNAQATDNDAVAIGYAAVSTSDASTCIGSQSDARYFSIGAGFQAQATGSFSTSLGANSSATAQYSTGLGYNADATGTSSIAIGKDSDAVGLDAIAIGNTAFADIGGVAIGSGANAPAQQIAFGSAISNTGAVNPTLDVPATFLWDVIVNGNPYKILMTL